MGDEGGIISVAPADAEDSKINGEKTDTTLGPPGSEPRPRPIAARETYKMLTPAGKKALTYLLSCGTSTALFPFQYDPLTHTLSKGTPKQLMVFQIHKYLMYAVTIFACVRLVNASLHGGFPLLLKILNIVFFAAYVLTAIAQIQFERKEKEILQFMNILLMHIFPNEQGQAMNRKTRTHKIYIPKQKEGDIEVVTEVDLPPVKAVNDEDAIINADGMEDPRSVEENEVDEDEEEKAREERRKKSLVLMPDSVEDVVFIKAERKVTRQLTYCFIFGMTLLSANPSVHVKLVQESPCAPNFLISAFYRSCDNYDDSNITLAERIVWMTPEYYITTAMFSSWSFNWAAIFLGTSWMVGCLRRMGYQIRRGEPVHIETYRQVEAIANMMNDAFVMYLTAFPSLLFAIVSILMFGIIRIWHNHPGSNIMFPLCGVRCFFEAVTPLEQAARMNTENKSLLRKWQRAMHTKKNKKLSKMYCRSFNGVCITAGSMYTFENTIVLTCLDNTMLLTFNMLLTFRNDN